MTLAELAAACDPPTTPQTIGRLETGTRTLSVDWIERIARALGVPDDALLASERREPVMVVARLTAQGAEPLSAVREALDPAAALGDAAMSVLEIDSVAGEYRSGDRLWLRRIETEDLPRAINRDVLVPRAGGRFAFGRLIDAANGSVALLPPGAGQRQLVVRDPAWIAQAAMLMRKL